MNVCNHCGSAACLQQSPDFCRHTRRARSQAKQAVPERDKMMRGAPVSKGAEPPR